MRLFLFVVLPLNLLAGLSMSHRIILHYHDETTADRAGALVLDKVPAAERKYLTIAGTDAVEMLRAQFHIDDKDSQLLLVPVNAPIGDDRVPTNQKWLLVMRNHPLPPAYQPLVRTDEFTLYRLTVQERPLGSTTFSEPSWNGIVTAAEGLSKAEPFGRWSDSKHVVLYLNTVLPAKVRVRIKASSYADNADLPFVLHIGSSSAVFRVPNNTMEERLLTLDTDGTQRTIVIDVPHPVSPQEHDHTTDIRTLGIAIGEIAIAAPES
jgi:phosphoglycerol transferase